MYKKVILGVILLIVVALAIQLYYQQVLQARYTRQQHETAKAQYDAAARSLDEEQAKRRAAGLSPTVVPETETVAPESFSVPDGPPKEFLFTVDTQKMADITVTGHFDASGHAGVEVYIFDEDNYSNWLDGNDSIAIFNSGRRATGDMNIRLVKSGTYHLVFRNSASSSALDVKSSIKVQYEKLAKPT